MIRSIPFRFAAMCGKLLGSSIGIWPFILFVLLLILLVFVIKLLRPPRYVVERCVGRSQYQSSVWTDDDEHGVILLLLLCDFQTFNSTVVLHSACENEDGKNKGCSRYACGTPCSTDKSFKPYKKEISDDFRHRGKLFIRFFFSVNRIQPPSPSSSSTRFRFYV